MLWLGRPQTHAKESRGWRRNGCRSRSSSGSPPWPGRSTPASRCGSSHSAPGCSLPAAAAPSPVGCACGAGATTSAITTCSAASDARPWRSPGSCSASSLSGSRAMGRARRWSSPSTTRPPSGTGRTSRASGKHHNPTPGPAGSPFLYGHVWVCLARLVRHSLWGAIALPILSHLYIRAKDVGWMAAYYGWQFHTKLELAAAQIEWLVQQLGPDHPPIWVVTDGAYVKRPFLKRVLGAGVTVISRLRCDAALWSLPVVVDPGQKKGRGRPPKYGKDRIDLARRTAQTRGWQTGLFSLYGRLVVKKYKTFLATYKPVGGVIRVVLVREPDRWVAYFSTDPDLSVASILETVADRSALEQVFHDVKEVHGAGQQQLRHVWANVGAWNLIGWWHTLVELWAWDRPQSRLRDRSDSPWDKPERRPSHANRCQELRREALQEEYSSLPSVGGLHPKIRRFIQRLMRRVA